LCVDFLNFAFFRILVLRDI